MSSPWGMKLSKNGNFAEFWWLAEAKPFCLSNSNDESVQSIKLCKNWLYVISLSPASYKDI